MPAGYVRSNDTGQGASIAFASSAIVADFRSIGETVQESERVKCTTENGDGWEHYVPGDYVEPGETECELIFSRRNQLPPLNEPQLITITFPMGPGDVVPARFFGTGFLTMRSLPRLATATLQTSRIRISWDGRATKPTFQPARVSLISLFDSVDAFTFDADTPTFDEE
jgi:hypothetical protein